MTRVTEFCRHLKPRRILLLLFTLPVLFNGCESLPPGKAPSGPIIAGGLFGKSSYSIEEAIEYMTTSLTAAIIRHNLRGRSIDKVFADSYSERVFVQTAAITGIRIAAGNNLSRLALRSQFTRQDEKMFWTMQLIDLNGNRIIWREKLAIHP